MCGIAGSLDLGRAGSAAERVAIAQRMGDAIRHRGPDAGGTWADPDAPVLLAHRRLAIIDLTPSGAQPMASPDERFWLVFNGEIYNFPALRHRLDNGAPRSWRGSSDTEVLLAALAEWGPARALSAADGMFALALWDRDRQELLLARDRFGEKPLYYGWQGTSFVFGSELRALRAHPSFLGTLNRTAFHQMLHLAAVPAPWSIYDGIRQLPPGTFLRLPLRSARAGILPEPETYWSAATTAQTAAQQPSLSDAEALEEADRLLGRAVGLRLFADVPLGTFLSGGIDSSLVTAYARRQSRGALHTYSMGFADAAFDESAAAAEIASRLDTRHTAFRVTEAEALAVVPALPHMYDEPFADSSQIPTYLVAQLARASVTVALTGDGGDELFGGYHRHIALPGLIRHQVWPRGVRRSLRRAVLAVPPDLLNGLLRATGQAHRFRHGATLVRKAADLWAADSPRDAYNRLVDPWHGADLLDGAPLALGTTWPFASDAMASAMLLDTLHGLPDDMLTKVDRATMAVALESRAPFLEPELFEFAWRLRPDQRVRGGQGKWLLRTLLRRELPADIVDAPKSGFAVPLGRWLRGALRPWAEELLAADSLGAYGLRADLIRPRWAAHQSGRSDESRALWPVLSGVAWAREWCR